jgi:hypothetical protein
MKQRNPSKSKVALVLASLGALLTGGISSSVTQTATGTQATEIRAQSAAPSTEQARPQSTPVRDNGALAGLVGSSGGVPMRSGGRTPYDWGISRACDRMRRKRKLAAAGIGSARI